MLIQDQPCLPPLQIMVLVGEFWLSGLFILSIIFTQSNSDDVQQLNLYNFISLGVGSLVGGYASDYLNRIKVFKFFTALWGISSIVLLLSPWAGYILASGCIGLLNNLTFVIIMEHFNSKKEIYTVFVLIGWAASQIVLGIFFMFFEQHMSKGSTVFYYVLFVLTMVLTIAVFVFLDFDEQNSPAEASPEEEEQVKDLENSLNGKRASEKQWYEKLLPHSYKPLIGGCVLMFVMQMFYYRTQFTLDQFGMSLALNTVVVGCTELVADLIFTRFVARAPRKLLIRVMLMLLMGLLLLLVLFSGRVVQTVIEGIMRLFDSSIMIVLGVYLPELFDEDERGKGCNYIMSFGVLGSALNSIILNNFEFWQLIFFLILAFCSTFLFKETFRPSSPL